jgi:hypothetical protein
MRIGVRGERLNLLIRQGATLGPFRASMVNPDSSPVDLTGAQIKGVMRKTAGAAAVIANLVVVISNAPGGLYEFSLPASVTAGIAAGLSETDADSRYVWSLDLVDAQGQVLPLYYGDVAVVRAGAGV